MHDQMEKLNVAFMKAFEDQNADAIGPMYTEDCKVMPTGQDVIHGRKGEVDMCVRLSLQQPSMLAYKIFKLYNFITLKLFIVMLQKFAH